MNQMRRWMVLMESQGETVTLLDLYDERDLTDPSEQLHNFVSRSDWKIPFTVQTASWEQSAQFRSCGGHETILATFKAHASRGQKKLVKDKMANYDASRIIVVCNDAVVDGNHHIIAAIMAKQPVRDIDLAEDA